MKPWMVFAGLASIGLLFMTKKLIGTDSDIFADTYDDLFIKYARRSGISPVMVKAISANESMVGKYQGNEPIGNTKGIMHIKLSTAQMFNKNLTQAELDKPEVEIDYGVRYIRWLWDRYSKFDAPERTRFTVMGYNGGPGRVDELIKKGESAVKNEQWFKNISTYWTRYSGHVAKLGGSTSNVA